MKRRNVIFLVIIVALTVGIVSSLITGMVINNADSGRVYVKTDEYEDLMYYFEIGEIADIVEEQYIDEFGREGIVDGALSGSVFVLDDGFSRYYTKEDFQHFDQTSEGSGIAQGIMIERDDESGYLRITRVFADTAAYEANLLKGDIITSIDGRDTKEIDIENAIARLRGQAGMEVTLEIISDGAEEPMEIKFKRRTDDVRVIYNDMLTESIGYVNIVEFGTGAKEDLKAALEELVENGAQKLIIDMRDANSGYISEAIACADLFLSEGVIANQYGREGVTSTWEADESVSFTGETVVAVNSNTAGCAEVFLAALKNAGAGSLGEDTPGKAYTFRYFELKQGGGIRLKTGGYTAQDGADLAKEGIKADYPFVAEVEDTNEDEVLNEAIRIFTEESE